MKKLVLLLILGVSLFAEGRDRSNIPYRDMDIIEQSEAYDVVCIRGYEYIISENLTIHQSFGEFYNNYYRIKLPIPIKCTNKKEVIQ